jgi:hypothetical protein
MDRPLTARRCPWKRHRANGALSGFNSLALRAGRGLSSENTRNSQRTSSTGQMRWGDDSEKQPEPVRDSAVVLA